MPKGRKRRRTNESKSITIVKGRKASRIVRSLKRRSKKKYRGKAKFNKKFGNDKRVMRPSELRKILNKPCIAQLRTNLGSHSGLNPIHRCVQRVTKDFEVTFDGTQVLIGTLKLNSSFDPLGDVGTEQAPGRDLLATMYRQYVVTKASVWWQPVYDNDLIVSVPNRIAYWGEMDGAILDNAVTFAAAREQGLNIKYSQNVLVGDQDFKRSGPMIKKGMIDCSKYMDDLGSGEYLATVGVAIVGADPTALCEYNMYCTEDDGTVIPNLVVKKFRVWVTQEVIYFGLLPAVADG